MTWNPDRRQEETMRNTIRWSIEGFALVAALWLAGAAQAFDHTHTPLDQVLQAHVSGGSVDYGSLATDRGALDAYLDTLADVGSGDVAGFSRQEAMAFWINAYNALTLKVILDHGQVASIRDIDGAWDGIRHDVAGRSLTLNEIEHQILRKHYPDARLHMVLVCAARSCPKLHAGAFTPTNLAQRLDAASTGFVRDSKRNRFDPEAGELTVSRIFEWYGTDFVGKYAEAGHGDDASAGIRGFFATYLDEPAAGAAEVTVSYMDYDWSLNGSW
jgi:hypothetical protein